MEAQRMGQVGSSHPWARYVPGFVKELGIFERMEAVIQEDCNSLLSHALFIISKVEVTPERMEKALDRMVRMIPQLRHCLSRYTPPGCTKPVPVLVEMHNPVINFEVLETSDWQDVITEEWKTKYNLYEELPWRVKLLPNVKLNRSDDMFAHECVVIFSCSHACFDGMSYQMLFGHLLDNLEAVYGEINDCQTQQVFPALDYYIGSTPTSMEKIGSVLFQSLIKTRIGRKLIMALAGLGEHNPYMAQVVLPIDNNPSIPIECRVYPVEFTKEETKNVIRAGKIHGVTVHGILHTAIVCSFVKTLLPEECSRSQLSLQGTCAVNLRFLMGQNAKKAIGQYALFFELESTVTQTTAYACEEFWGTAKQCSKNIKKAVKQKEYLNIFKILRMLIPIVEGTTTYKVKDFATERYGRQSVPINITNMGNNEFLSRGDDAAFKLVGRFGGGSEHNSGSIIMHNVNTFNDQMFMSMLYCPHIIPESQVQKHTEMLKYILYRHCHESEV